MLNPFPIQFLSLLAYFILRLFVGGVLLVFGIRLLRSLSWPATWRGRFLLVPFALLEVGAAGFILAGAFTQYAALLTMGLAGVALVSATLRQHPAVPQRAVYVLLFGCALSLFITGAGAVAFDLPL